ncbi:hypothetical protein JCM11251_001966 [Rhodosporidiobolus azoricus]
MSVSKQPPTYQQPQAQPIMVVGGHQHAPAEMVGSGKGGRDFTTGLCDCGDDFGGCCKACWCPCITHSETRQRLDALKAGRMLSGDEINTCGFAGGLYCGVLLFTGFGWIFDCLAREEIRKRYNLSEGSCGSFWKTLCCNACAQRQHVRELSAEEQLLLTQGHVGEQNAYPVQPV